MSHGFGFFFGIYAISVNSLYQFRCIGLVCKLQIVIYRMIPVLM